MKSTALLSLVMLAACSPSTSTEPTEAVADPQNVVELQQQVARLEKQVEALKQQGAEPADPPAEADEAAPAPEASEAEPAPKPRHEGQQRAGDSNATGRTKAKTSDGTKPATKETSETSEAKPAPEPKAATRARSTRIPRTDHVRVRVSDGLQKLLDEDPRMQPWVNKVMQVADRCYAQVRSKSPNAKGIIKVRVTMHESARPSPDVQDLPPSLSGVVACATGALFQTRMPLFTGPEGQRHPVSVHFTP